MSLCRWRARWGAQRLVDWENIRALLTEALLPQWKEAAEETKVQPEAEPAEPAQTEQPEAVQETQPEVQPEQPVQTQAKPEPELETAQIIPEEHAENQEKSAAEADVYDQPAQEDPSGAALRELLTPLPEEKCWKCRKSCGTSVCRRRFFRCTICSSAFRRTRPLKEVVDEVFIRVPLGGAYGEIDHYLVGARIADGWVTAVGYLIPGEYAETPPAGMSGLRMAGRLLAGLAERGGMKNRINQGLFQLFCEGEKPLCVTSLTDSGKCAILTQFVKDVKSVNSRFIHSLFKSKQL